VIVGTLDTKAEEIAYFREQIEKRGHRAIVVDCSILGTSRVRADIGKDEVAIAAGETIEVLKNLGDEAKALDRMAVGAANIVRDLHSSGSLDGIFALGGSMGTFLGLSAMKALPLEVPKVMLSTVVLTPFIRPEMAPGDVILMSAIVDLWGLNSLIGGMLEKAAGITIAAAEASRAWSLRKPQLQKKLVGVTTLGTAVCRYLPHIKPLLEQAGYEVLIFHTIGVGGRFLEQLISQDKLCGVMDLATNELVNEICGGSYIAGPERLETAGRKGIPQLVSVGGCEAFGWGRGMETLPEHFKSRTIQLHSKITFAVKATKEEMAEAARLMAEKLNRSGGPVTVVLPMRGFSERDKEGMVFYDPEGRRAFRDMLKERLGPEIKLKELDQHINDEAFSKEVVRLFLSMTGK
jgi:uncharacterized protein (UPF0261 family)